MAQEPVQFKIYYADGTTFTGSPFNAPALNVILILERSKDNGRRVVSGGDYFVWGTKAERWWSVDRPGMFQYLCDLGPRRVLLGRMVDNDIWNGTWRTAMSDPDFPPKGGTERGEDATMVMKHKAE